ncbi:MAG: kynureninase, partial [Caulobacteraceae bacterium]
MGPTLDEARALDAADPLASFRDRFSLPKGVIYLDGNSLGPPPTKTRERIGKVISGEWGEGLIGSWEKAGWIAAPARIGAKIAPLVGASAHEVIVGDSTSVNLFKLMAATLAAQPERRTVLIEADDFPTDLYLARGVAGFAPDARLKIAPPGGLCEFLGPDIAIAVLSHVHYKTAERRDMAAISRAARDCGAFMLWDLSHSVGAVRIDLHGAGADLAVGCGYKHLNGGPGAPAFLFVAERHQARLENPLSGWMGHADPFAFAPEYRPAKGIARFLVGTPPILGLSALEAGVEIVSEAGAAAIEAKAARLFEFLAACAASRLACFDLTIIGPSEAERRGGHVCLRHPDAGRLIALLAERGVIGDFRPPDLARFGLSPLF